MRYLKTPAYILTLALAILTCCTNTTDYKIERKFKSLVNNTHCQIEFWFPQFAPTNPALDISELNDVLEKYADLNYHIQSCERAVSDKQIIKGDFSITLQTEEKLSIEYFTTASTNDGLRSDTVYHSLVVNPKKIKEKDISQIGIELESLLPSFDRGSLKKYVDRFNKIKNENINLLAYESGSRYAVTWGLSKNHLILYVGGEGEAFGHYKIKIPLTELIDKK